MNKIKEAIQMLHGENYRLTLEEAKEEMWYLMLDDKEIARFVTKELGESFKEFIEK